MLFSQRKGYKEINKIIQKDTMNDELRNSIWNALECSVSEPTGQISARS
jgi:hypothetical protein